MFSLVKRRGLMCNVANSLFWRSIIYIFLVIFQGLWSYGSWIYNYLCNQCLSPLTLWVKTPVHGEVYSIQDYVINFLRVLRFPPPRYNWNMVESGVKHYKPSHYNQVDNLIFPFTFRFLRRNENIQICVVMCVFWTCLADQL